MRHEDKNGFIEFSPLMQSDRYLFFDAIGVTASNMQDKEVRDDLLRDFTVLAKMIKFTKESFKSAEYKVDDKVLTEWNDIEGSIKCSGLVTTIAMHFVFGVDTSEVKEK